MSAPRTSENLCDVIARARAAVADVAATVAAQRCMREPFGCGRQLVVAVEFRDDESRGEYKQSALCQRCQDAAFNEEDA